MALKPSLSLCPALLPSLSLFSLSLSLSSYLTLPFFFAASVFAPPHTHILTLNEYPQLPLSCYLTVNTSDCLIPAGVREAESERQTRSEARHLRVSLYGTEGVSAWWAGPTPIHSENEQLQACTFTHGEAPAASRYREVTYTHSLTICACEMVKREREPQGLHVVCATNSKCRFGCLQSPSTCAGCN